jgi:hypothetical protein
MTTKEVKMYSVSIEVKDPKSQYECGNLDLYVEVVAKSPEDAIREVADNIDEVVEQNRIQVILKKVAENTNKILRQWEEGLITENEVRAQLAMNLSEAYSDTVTIYYREEV